MDPSYVPPGIRNLKLFGNHRVPWFVSEFDGDKPEFRLVDTAMWFKATRRRLCWICGEALVWQRYAFVVGPMCTINRVSADPAMHKDCAIYSAIHCPFLNDPDRTRREDDETRKAKASSQDFGMIEENPGVTAVWLCKKFELSPGAGNKTIVRMGRPRKVIWFHRGEPATRAQVEEAVTTGIPTLRGYAKIDGPVAMELLEEMEKKAKTYWPKN